MHIDLNNNQSFVLIEEGCFRWYSDYRKTTALLKMDFQQKLYNSAIFGYFYFKII